MTTVRMTPAHPGDFIRTEVVEALQISVTDAARVLGVSRVALSNLLNAKADLSAEMAIRLQKAFGLNAGTLLRMQAAYDLSRAEKHSRKIHVEPYRPRTPRARALGHAG
jgi:addiction module HigA family antidote